MSATRPAGALGLGDHLAARTLPLAVALVAVVGVSAPTAIYVVRVDELAAHGALVASHVADDLRVDATRRPVLWRYDSIKIVEHLRAYRMQPDVARIEVVDRHGRALGLEAPPDASGPLLWTSAPIGAEPPAGEVWVAMSLAGPRAAALLLLLPFLALGLLLGGLVFHLPGRAMRRAERRIAGLVDELEELNRGLEGQVRERLTELEAAYGELEERDRRLRTLSGRAVAMQEAERRAIARELHDAVGQALTAIRIHLQLMEQASEEEETTRLARRTRELTDSALEEVRRAVDMLGPAILGDVGLTRAVERHCADVAERTGIDVTCEVDVGDRALPPAVETTCYRMVQEALNNTVRHAQATYARVVVRAGDAHVEVRVRDDGRGFDPAAETDGHGVTGMRERVEVLGGSFSIDSGAETGTVVAAELPLPAVAGAE